MLQRVLTAMLLCAWVHSSQPSPTCDELGFTGHTLCADCKQLSEMVKDQELTDECLQCCTEQATSDKTYSSAVLEVCFYRLSSTPHVEGFVKRKASAFKGLRVEDRWGAPPRLILKTDGKFQESVRIDGWKGEQIEEFLKNKLVVDATA